MRLDEFLYNLQFDTEKVRPPDWEVDWEDAPLPYKLYRDLPVFPLSLEVPLTLEGEPPSSEPDIRSFGHFLWYVFGLSQVSQFEQEKDVVQSFRRFAPSGGALYPNELYVYLKLENVPSGVYHYDAAHHRLILLREGNFDSYLAEALGNRCKISECFGTVFVSTMFWKNFYKYNNFSYRLQGLDAGVLMGQLLETAKRFGFSTGVFFQFLDKAINHLLGLVDLEESTYAVIPLSVNPVICGDSVGEASVNELCRELPAMQCHHYMRSKRLKPYPLLIEMNEASMMETTKMIGSITTKDRKHSDGEMVKFVPVKPLLYDLAAISRKRFSPEMDFIFGKVSNAQLASLLKEATSSFEYQNDLDEQDHSEPRVSIYGCLYNIEGIQNGAYMYDEESHILRQLNAGDYRNKLQYGMTLDNVNLQIIPLCLHVAGDRNHYRSQLGYRGYRIQQMEAGMLVQRLLLTSSALGMGGHPLLGFDVNVCDEIYRNDEITSLIQLPIGHYQSRAWLKGSLQS